MLLFSRCLMCTVSTPDTWEQPWATTVSRGLTEVMEVKSSVVIQTRQAGRDGLVLNMYVGIFEIFNFHLSISNILKQSCPHTSSARPTKRKRNH